jgi:nucleoside-diphosphate-sugar epimerase
MKTLVTGGTGFLGSHLVERLLEEGHEVHALARSASDISHLKTTAAEIIIGDIEDYESLRPAVEGVDVVYHAAARVTPGWGAWKYFHSAIVKGTENMLRASAEAGVSRFLHVSTGTVHGKHCEGDTPACESTTRYVVFGPDSYYDYAKLKAEDLAFEYHKQGKIPVSMVRIGVIYGPRDRLLADRVFRQISMPVIVWPGDLNPRYSVVYVSDAVDIIIMAATSDRAEGQVYNVSANNEIRLKDFAAAMVQAVGSKKRQVTIPYAVGYAWCSLMEGWARLRRVKEMPYLTRSALKFLNKGLYLDGTKAREELGWEPKVPMEEGTRLYIEWRRAQGKK